MRAQSRGGFAEIAIPRVGATQSVDGLASWFRSAVYVSASRSSRAIRSERKVAAESEAKSAPAVGPQRTSEAASRKYNVDQAASVITAPRSLMSATRSGRSVNVDPIWWHKSACSSCSPVNTRQKVGSKLKLPAFRASCSLTER